MKVERSIQINASPEAVYSIVMDPRRLGDWVIIQDELVESPDRELEKGDRLVQKLKVAGQGFEVAWNVTRADRPAQVEWEGEGPMGTTARVAYGMKPDGEGTTFDYMNEYELPGGLAGRLAGRAVASVAGREAEKTLDRLKRLVEGE
jgi:carbon monoxide dehydrogenase subunit G